LGCFLLFLRERIERIKEISSFIIEEIIKEVGIEEISRKSTNKEN
jgi:hypothetical protein